MAGSGETKRIVRAIRSFRPIVARALSIPSSRWTHQRHLTFTTRFHQSENCARTHLPLRAVISNRIVDNFAIDSPLATNVSREYLFEFRSVLQGSFTFPTYDIRNVFSFLSINKYFIYIYIYWSRQNIFVLKYLRKKIT